MEYRQALQDGHILAEDYRIAGVLGQGGFAITYRAEDLKLGSEVAVKEFFPSELAVREASTTVRAKSAQEDDVFSWARQKFLDEARTLARFRHPAIVRVARVFEANNTAYMVLDFERGSSLEKWLSDLGHPPTQAELDHIARRLLDALEIVHAGNVLHRDIAPDNIIMRDGREPVLIDFGAARAAVGARSRTIHAVVKAGYSPKEQYALDLDLQGPWTDIYALAATLYRAATGRAPQDAMTRDLSDATPPAITAALASYRPAFLAAIDRALSPRHQERPQTVAQWRTELFSEFAPTPTSQPRTPVSGGRPPYGAPSSGPPGGQWSHTAQQYPQPPPVTQQWPSGQAYPPQGHDPFRQAPVAGRSGPSGLTIGLIIGAVLIGIGGIGGAWYLGERDRISAQEEVRRKARAAEAEAKRLADEAEARRKSAKKDAPPARPPSSPGPAGRIEDRAGGGKGVEETKGVDVPAGTPETADRTDLKKPPPDLRPDAFKGRLSTAPTRTIKAHADFVHSVAVTPDGRYAITGGKDGVVKIFELATGRETFSSRQHSDEINQIALSADGTRLASGGDDSTVRIWEIPSGRVVRTIQATRGLVISVAFSPDGRNLLVGHFGGDIVLYEVASGREIRVVGKHGGSVYSLAFSADGRTAISGSQDQKIQLWDVNAGRSIRTFSGHTDDVRRVVFLSGGQQILSAADDHTFRIWDVATGREARLLSRFNSFALSASVSPDGRYVVGGYASGTIKLWELSSGRELSVVTGAHGDWIRSLAFAPDGRSVITASDDGTVKVWPVQ